MCAMFSSWDQLVWSLVGLCLFLLSFQFLFRKKTTSNQTQNNLKLKEGMKPIPSKCLPYKRLPNDPSTFFTTETIPKGLLSRHNTKKGVWGKLIVVRGKLLYRQLEPEEEEFVLEEGVFGVVEPQLYHEVCPMTEELAFFIVFHQ